MAVNNRYFPHDSNAKDDPKCVLLIDDMGMEGYGIYWMLIEVLREQPDYSYPIANAMALARRYNTSTESVKQVIYKYDLFVVEEDRIFFSESLNRRMAEVEARALRRSEVAKMGAATRWQRAKDDAEAMPKQCLSIAEAMPTDSTSNANQCQYKSKSKTKDKENTTKESASMRFVPPTLDEVREFISTNGYTLVNAEAFHSHYASVGWKRGKTPLKDWKQAVINWQATERQNKPQEAEQPAPKRKQLM